jgi:hypothetical protein
MKTKNIIGALLGLGLMGGVVSCALAQSGNNNDKPSPAAEATITRALKALYPGAAITKMSKDEDDGFYYYSVALTAAGGKVDAEVTSDGTVIKTTAAGEVKSFPAAAAAAITKTAAGAKVTSASLTTTYAKVVLSDSTGDIQTIHVQKLPQPDVAYAVAVETDGKTGKFSVGADGTVVKALKWKLASSAGAKTE